MASFDPSNVDLNTVDPAQVVCYLNSGGNEYNGHLGARISSVFVILVISTFVTIFPVAAKRVPSLKIPLYVYLFARYFGTGVIIATAFVHLLDPAYQEIGPASCVGMTGNWAVYSWPPALVLASVTVIFLMDFGAELYVETKYGLQKEAPANIVSGHVHREGSQSYTQDQHNPDKGAVAYNSSDTDSLTAEISMKQQLAAFLILEFGVIFHSVIIGLNLGVAGDEFATLYPVLVFHQSFEGLGIGARLSAIEFRRGLHWVPWVLCIAYGLTTPIAIAIGLGVRTTYNPESNTANIVSGVLDSISAGILIYTGLVELLARDFLFDPCRTNSRKQLGFMIVSTLLGAGIMALLGKWA
ncbi:high affinity zinc ion transporter, putative [Paecilomyces variotii No. 5]|uniref:High affinity zinc ion transporter, putative n=1 Tax=Byssochlamys spectabilis (strain No. 5 / NBRC 109023) TaxID=1356009 RepID=V5FK75_BYSSN|nr:high affinity zinc ion transporter, putative [Paecilomyces variotii No. 5]